MDLWSREFTAGTFILGVPLASGLCRTHRKLSTPEPPEVGVLPGISTPSPDVAPVCGILGEQ